jgi:hypothetical protein
MEASELKEILDQHQLWYKTNGVQGKRATLKDGFLYCANLSGADLYRANLTRADLTGADLTGADLTGADLTDANLWGANLWGANLTGANLEYVYLKDATGLPNVSWIIPGCLVQLNRINPSFYLYKEDKYQNFIQDSFGFIIENNPIEETFDMLVEERIIRNIPDWVKYSGLKKAS